MMISRERIKRNLKQLVLYGIIGGFAASIDFFIFNILTVCTGLYYLTANCFSVLIGILTSFTLNRTFNFKVKDKVTVRFTLFFAIGMLGLVLSNAVLWLGVDKCHFSEAATKIFSIFIVAFIQFIFNKLFTFKQT